MSVKAVILLCLLGYYYSYNMYSEGTKFCENFIFKLSILLFVVYFPQILFIAKFIFKISCYNAYSDHLSGTMWYLDHLSVTIWFSDHLNGTMWR